MLSPSERESRLRHAEERFPRGRLCTIPASGSVPYELLGRVERHFIGVDEGVHTRLLVKREWNASRPIATDIMELDVPVAQLRPAD